MSEEYLMVVPTRYGPPWHEGVSNLARRLVQELRDAGKGVEVLTIGPPADGDRGEFGERVVRFGGGDMTLLSRIGFWARVVLSFLRTRGAGASAFVFTSLSNGTTVRTRILHIAIGGGMVVYVTGLATPDPSPDRTSPVPGKVVVISPFLHRWLPGAPVVGPFLPIGFEGPVEAPEFPRDGEPFRFFFLGAYEPGRGVEDLVRAFDCARTSNRKLELTLAINGVVGRPAGALEEWVQREGLGEGVTVKGIVDTAEEYQKCHAVVIPRQSTTRMAFPVRLIEAAHWKRPIITTTACDIHRLVRPDGEDAPEPGDTPGLAQSLSAISSDRDSYAAAVDDILKFRERYDPESSLRLITGILTS